MPILLDALDTCLLVVDPCSQHLNHLPQLVQKQLAARFQMLIGAASAVEVPCHYVLENAAARKSVIVPVPSDQQRVYTLPDIGPAWHQSGVADALVAANRTRLVISGFWLERRVSFFALCALSTGFDVYLLTDLAPACADYARAPSLFRLWQAGATPVTTHQLIAEWAEQTTDRGVRAHLIGLVMLDSAFPQP